MLFTIAALALLQAPPAKEAPKAADPNAKWEKNIAAIEEKLKKSPPKDGATFFSGSSTIVRWDLKKYFPDQDYVNVGFGGSKIAECNHFAPRILTPYKPGTIVFAAGGNDLAAKESPEKVAEDFKKFVATIRKESPKCHILFISVKPTIRREAIWDKEVHLNSLIKEFCEKGENLTFINVVPDLLDANGKPKREMLVDDLLHPSHEGYVVLTAAVKAALAK
jgi:lysophospholipase L1-like esterase